MKLSSISFALVLIFSLAACNGKKESSAPTNTATGPSSKIQLKSKFFTNKVPT